MLSPQGGSARLSSQPGSARLSPQRGSKSFRASSASSNEATPHIAARKKKSRGKKRSVEVKGSKFSESESEEDGSLLRRRRRKGRSPRATKSDSRVSNQCEPIRELNGKSEGLYEPPMFTAEAKRRKARQWVFGAWGYMISWYAALVAIALSAGAIVFRRRHDARANPAERAFAPAHEEYYLNWKFLWANYASLGMGCAFFCLPTIIPALHSSGPPKFSFIRSFFYFIASGLCGWSFFLLVPCILYGMATVITMISAFRWEEGELEGFGLLNMFRAQRAMIKRCCCVRLRQDMVRPKGRFPPPNPSWWRYQVARGIVARGVLFVLWWSINAGLMIKNYYAAIEKVKSVAADEDATCYVNGKRLKFAGESGCLNYADTLLTYLPIAKACGICLDFNCALILVLIVEKVVKALNHSMGRNSRFLVWMPVHKMLLFHQWVGAAIFFFSLGHAFGHFMAQTYILDLVNRPVTLDGVVTSTSERWVMLSVWATGVLLFVLMVFCYGISIGPARRFEYNLFMRVHVGCGLLFIIILFWHAQAFLFWGLAPFILYLMDLAGRSASSETSLRLVEVELIDNVLALIFVTPFQYKSGTYCRLRCPLLPKKGEEWHPFTISSAYSSNMLGFHIKVHPGGWTEGVRDLLIQVARESKKRKLGTKLVDNNCGFRYQFKDRDWLSGHEMLGLAPTWEGKPLFVCSAPHAAPAMHHDRFKTIIIAGAGIGLTPVNSIITEMLHYKWRRGLDTKVENMYAAWMCPHSTLGAFRWFMESSSNCDTAYKLCDAKKHHYEMHIFVTSSAAPSEDAVEKVPTVGEVKTYGNDACTAVRPYTASDLLDATQKAVTPIANFANVMKEKDHAEARGSPDPFGRTRIWNGRPDWDALMERISFRHAEPKEGHRVGVFFCGAPAIAEAVRQSAQRYTNSGIAFHVFKENF